MVLVKEIEFYSLCEHHLLPFFGKAHIAYILDGNIVGLSKLPRVLDVFSIRLQLQERLTNEIRDCIHDTLKPKGVALVMEARHLCMQMRGVEKQSSLTTTSAFSGAFLESECCVQHHIIVVNSKKLFYVQTECAMWKRKNGKVQLNNDLVIW